ncbi:adenosine 3'-phospho 5'-phosphosulfate transporter 2 isoform X2 [Chiloscyllium plagiosum]|uniref:adenosine 3'-phospho 5'-phosphosulfate transporter 2 isoform X2 n=1 Tax=Chiloscyllium plagiosum TaxID=36176 RepID=UPI001CB821F2|nr:adenosine 3'-phospho 5'-phosphosulfate transporter 2 isoform X2 [Chiloscyllium plagiosum]
MLPSPASAVLTFFDIKAMANTETPSLPAGQRSRCGDWWQRLLLQEGEAMSGSRKYISISVPDKPDSMSPHIKSAEELRVIGLNLSDFSRTVQFLICVSGVFIFYLIYGYLQELIFSVEGFKPFGWYLTLVQFAFYSTFGLIEQQLTQDKRRRIPWKTYMLIAFLTVATMGLSNTSLGYLNYPTQVIFKCCKLIPVMIGGVFIQGIAFISMALCADAVIGNVQEKAMKLHNGSNSEMVLYSYSLGFLYILTGLFCTQGLGPAFVFCSRHPTQTYGYAFMFSLTGYFGISFVLALIKLFGALVAVTVTTGRKAMTIGLSFFFFAKPFTFHYLWSGIVVLLGIFLNIYSKNRDKIKLPSPLDLWNVIKKKQIRSMSQTV